MSFLIKGMEMPTRCEDCFCYRHNAEYDYAYCNISSVNVLGNANARLNNCPLVPVPPHGDLIDRRYAIATACSGRIRTLPTTEDGENWIRVEEVRESIKNAPTIIPAEEGE